MSQNEANGARPYEVQQVSVVVAGNDVQVREFTVAPQEKIPWHYHSLGTDWCYCLEGIVVAEILDSATHNKTAVRLAPGQSCRINPGTVHRLVNGGDVLCRYLLVQGGGKYDFNKVEDPAGAGAS